MVDESGNRKVIDMDSVNRGIATVTSVAGVIFAVYLHITAMIQDVESRIIELEKQNLRDEKFQEYAIHSKRDIENIQNELRSLNETTIELMRIIRANEQQK